MHVDPAADDFRVSPWLYPGRPAHTSGVLVDGRFVALDAAPSGLDAVLHEARAVPLAERLLVVAIGSNASPAVMQRKFAAREVSTTIPFFTGRITDVAVGHSAHVSVPGYVPAAPFHSPGALTPVVASLLDRRQVEALDATEPTYVRIDVPREVSRLRLDHAPDPDSYTLYVSRRGLLAAAGGTPIPLGTQHEVLPSLYRYLEVEVADAGGDERVRVESVMRALAASAELRESVRRCLRAEGLVVTSGLGGDADATSSPT